MKAVVVAFNQEKALVEAFSVITTLRMDLFEGLVWARWLRTTAIYISTPLYLYIYSAISRYLLRDVTRYCNYLSNTLDSAAGMRADEPRPRTTHALPSAQAQCPATTLRPAYFYKQTVLCLHLSLFPVLIYKDL